MDAMSLMAAVATLVARRSGDRLADQLGQGIWNGGRHHLVRVLRRRFAGQADATPMLDAVVTHSDRDATPCAAGESIVAEARHAAPTSQVTNHFEGRTHVGRFTVIGDVGGDVRL